MTEQVYREEQQQSSWGSFWESFAALFQKQEQTYVPQVQQVLEQKRGSVLKAVYAPQIEVYYWGPAIQNGQLGHLALRIIDDDEDIYISHWPRKWYKFIMSESAQKSSFLFDVEDEAKIRRMVSDNSDIRAAIEGLERLGSSTYITVMRSSDEYIAGQRSSAVIAMSTWIAKPAHRPYRRLFGYLAQNPVIPVIDRLRVEAFAARLTGPTIGYYCLDLFPMNSNELCHYVYVCCACYLLIVVYAPQVEVYYWGPSIKNLQIGHLALRIIDDEEDIYISHWPKVTIKCLNSEPAHKLSFINDMEDE
ncbi:unnamed protein product, partial [Medioppia subpectinata]